MEHPTTDCSLHVHTMNPTDLHSVHLRSLLIECEGEAVRHRPIRRTLGPKPKHWNQLV